MKETLDSVLPPVRVKKHIRRWLERRAKAECGGNIGKLLRKWIAEKHLLKDSAT